MNRLPAHHVPRPRLLAALERAPVGLIEAGGGFGKSVLAAELRDRLGVATAEAALEAGDHEPGLLLARLRRAFRRAGLSDAAALLAEAPSDPVDAVNALLDAVTREREPVLLIVDDAHHAAGEAEGLLVRLARDLPPGHRLLLLGRRLPQEADLLQAPPGVALMRGAELAFTPQEVAELFRRGFEAGIGSSEAEALHRATGGWAAALVLAGLRVRRAADPAAELRAILDQPTVLTYLVHENLRKLDAPQRGAAVQLAHLPLVSEEAAAALGPPDLFEAVVDAGLPLAPSRDGWWELPGPVQDVLRGLAPLDRAAARRVAALYSERGELAAALRLLLGAGDGDAAASLLADAGHERLDGLDYLELEGLVRALPEAAVGRHPRVLLQLARACEPAARARERADALARLRATLRDGRDPRLAHEVEAELARDLVRDGRADEAEALAAAILAALESDETVSRVRLLHVLGRVKAWRCDPASLAEAQPLLEEATRLYLRLGHRSWALQASLSLAYHVLYPLGRHEEAVAKLDEVLAGLAGRSRLRAVALTFRAEVQINRGRYAEAEANLAEAAALGRDLGDERVLAYVAWERARAASQAGDAARTVALVRLAERHRGEWYEHATGAEFLADAVDLLDRVGETELAREYLARARERAIGAELAVGLAEAAVLARTGDPAAAAEALEAVSRLPRFEPRERWRLSLLAACAAERRGDPTAGALAAEAFERALALGQAELPLVRERAAAERLLPLAVEAGSTAAAALSEDRLPVAITVLGRLEVFRGGRPLALPPGKPAELLKLLAAVGGRMHAEEAIEALWPEVEPASGRKRLRNALNRLRQGTGELVAREGEVLRLAPGIEVDAELFARDAARALEGAGGSRDDALAAARSAVARYGGPLLPDDRYEAWAAAPRERLARRFLALLDLLASEAEARGDLDEALRLLERAIEADPYDVDRYLRAARLVLGQGRRVPAARMLRRAKAVLEKLGLPPPPALLELARAVRE